VQALVGALGDELGPQLLLALRSMDDPAAESHLMQVALRHVRQALAGPASSHLSGAASGSGETRLAPDACAAAGGASARPQDGAGDHARADSTSAQRTPSGWLGSGIAQAVQANLAPFLCASVHADSPGENPVEEARALEARISAAVAALNVHRFLRMRCNGALPTAYAAEHDAAAAQVRARGPHAAALAGIDLDEQKAASQSQRPGRDTVYAAMRIRMDAVRGALESAGPALAEQARHFGLLELALEGADHAAQTAQHLL
jgi:hypothetical protein